MSTLPIQKRCPTQYTIALLCSFVLTVLTCPLMYTQQTESTMKDSVFTELGKTVVGDTWEEKVQIAKRMEIKRYRRIGRYNRQRARPLSVEFKYKEDIKYIMDNKSYLRRGVFVDFEYTADIEQTRSLLLPILRKARQTEPFKGHCKMEEDRLVIKGRTYMLNNLHQLPDDLNCFKVTSKQNDHCVGFFGSLNPLSNFHHAAFTLDGIDYISAEQFIQSKKAEYFNDRRAYDLIIGCSTSLDCKKSARQIKGFDRNLWEANAKACCMPGIRAKFQQNVDLMATLQSKTGTKQLVECSNDSFWGNGMPINKPDCLDQSKWISQGILGEILEEI